MVHLGVTKARQVDCGTYVHYEACMPEVEASASPIRPLYSAEQLARIVKEMEERLAQDESETCRRALKSEFAAELRAQLPAWYQRIDFPKHGLASTSDHSRAVMDEGSLNRLAGRLSSTAACILRPWPKWCVLREIMPVMTGKSVLEVGSSCGFFSFRFAEAGAAHVTGVEINRAAFQAALWAAKVLEHRNVSFLNSDVIFDLTIPVHDIVFLSEVHNHLLCPFYGLVRVINLARETVVFETGVQPGTEHALNLSSAWRKADGSLFYHSFQLSDGLIMDYLYLIGMPRSSVVRYQAPDQPGHMVYLIDTSKLSQTRISRNYPAYLKAALASDGSA